MKQQSSRSPSPSGAPTTANDRFKGQWRAIFWSGTALGIIVHAAVLAALPGLEIVDESPRRSAPPHQLLQVLRMADVAISAPAFADIPVPEFPALAPLDLSISLDSPVDLPDFSEFERVDQSIAPTIRTIRDEWLDYRTFAPYVVRPEIRNRDELKFFLQSHYQRIFEYSGATGVVQVSFWINESGTVEKAEIRESSGVRSLDRLALRLSRVLRFRPAMMAGRPIRILVHVPITFRAA